MKSIDITNITGLNFPYTIYACDVYDNNCILIATITTSVPPISSIVLPYQFDSAPAVGIKIITFDNCEKFHHIICNPTPTPTPTVTQTPTMTQTPTNTKTPTPTPTKIFCPGDLIVNPNFTNNLNGWTTFPLNNWIWDSNLNGSAMYVGVDEGGNLSQNILTIGATYNISFDVLYDQIEPTGQSMSVFAGATEVVITPSLIIGELVTINLTMVCTTNTTFSIYAIFFNYLELFVTNVCIIETLPPPTPTPTPTQTQTPTNTPTNTTTQTQTQTQTSTQTPTNTNTPTQTPTQTPTNTITPTNTQTQTPTQTPTNTPTQTPTNTQTQTPTPTLTQTPTNTNTPTQTPTQTPTPTLNPCPNCTVQDITIGTQTWSKCNLDVTTYRNGDVIPQVTDQTTWNNLTTGAWCYYNNDSVTGTTYGKLYNWYAVTDPRGLAPTGYHIPSDTEWTTLVNYLGGTSPAGGAMKETGGCHWLTPNQASNSSGFSAFGGGIRTTSFNLINNQGLWWSSTDFILTFAYYRYIAYNSTNINSSVISKANGLSVRLIKD